MKKLLPLLILGISLGLLSACDDVEGRLKSRRGGFSDKEKQNTRDESSFIQNLNTDSLDKIYKKDFHHIVDLIKSKPTEGLYKNCSDDLQDKYSQTLINKYLTTIYSLAGPMNSYKQESSAYDYDAEFECINSTVEFHSIFEKCEGNVSMALTSEDDDTEVTDFYIDLDDIFEIKPINKAVKDLFALLEKKEYKAAYDNASENFKRLNYENYFETLLGDIPNIKFAKLDFTDAIFKMQEETDNVLLELGYSLPNYAGVVINFIVQSNDTFQLESFEYVEP